MNSLYVCALAVPVLCLIALSKKNVQNKFISTRFLTFIFHINRDLTLINSHLKVSKVNTSEHFFRFFWELIYG